MRRRAAAQVRGGPENRNAQNQQGELEGLILQNDLGDGRAVRCGARDMGCRTDGAVMMTDQITVMVKTAQYDSQEQHHRQAASIDGTPRR